MSILRASLLPMFLLVGACGDSSVAALAPPGGGPVSPPASDAAAAAQAEFERVRALEAGCCADPEAKRVSR